MDSFKKEGLTVWGPLQTNISLSGITLRVSFVDARVRAVL